MSPVSLVFHTVVTVSWSQRQTKDDDIHCLILDVHAFQLFYSKKLERVSLRAD